MASLDLRDIRSSLKLVTDTGGFAVYTNMEAVACPVCGDAFDEVMELTANTHSVEPMRQLSFCIVNDPATTFIFTHA